MNYDLYMKRLASRINKSKYSVAVAVDCETVPVFVLGEVFTKRIPIPFTEYEVDAMVCLASNFDKVHCDTIYDLAYDVRYCLSTVDKKTKQAWKDEKASRCDSLCYVTDEAVSLLVG